MVGRISAQPPLAANPVCDDNPMASTVPNAVTGAMNRPGNRAPAANPTEATAATPAPSTAIDHHGSPPQTTTRPRRYSITAMNTR